MYFTFMSILSWDKPKKVKETGTCYKYESNMSKEDEQKWKAKITGHRVGKPKIEIRKIMNGTNIKVIISDGKNKGMKHALPGCNVHLSLNGTCQMSFIEYDELHQAIEEARAVMEQAL